MENGKLKMVTFMSLRTWCSIARSWGWGVEKKLQCSQWHNTTFPGWGRWSKTGWGDKWKLYQAPHTCCEVARVNISHTMSPHTCCEVARALSEVEWLKGSLLFIFVSKMRSQVDTVSSTVSQELSYYEIKEPDKNL